MRRQYGEDVEKIQNAADMLRVVLKDRGWGTASAMKFCEVLESLHRQVGDDIYLAVWAAAALVLMREKTADQP